MLAFTVATQVALLAVGVCQTGSTRTCKLTGCASAVQVCTANRTWGACACNCDDGNACTADSFAGSRCVHAPVSVDDGNPCTEDACSVATGVTHTAVAPGTSCSDGNACNGAETCTAAATCVAGPPPSLDDGNPCTADSCDPAVGVRQVPVAAGTSCSDGNACNGSETCDGAGVCRGGPAFELDDGNPCTADTCDPVAGVLHVPVDAGSSCSDGNACNGDEVCGAGGTCLAGEAPAVADGNACTIDRCDPRTGVIHDPAPAQTSCSDGNYCNGFETCDGAGSCIPGLVPSVDDGNPCTADRCDPALGVFNDPLPAGASCSDGNACNGVEVCGALATCASPGPPAQDDDDPCTADACDPIAGVTHIRIAGCVVLPPDPAQVAPPLDRTAVTGFATATAFLYEGANPIQTGVAPGTIEPRRAAVLRGYVRDREGAPLAGVDVRLLAHPELGRTLTRADGAFDLAVNGGGTVTVTYQKDGYLPAHRKIDAPWRDFAWVDEVALVAFDTRVTAVALGAPSTQVAQGSSVSDADGARQATIVIPPGTQASMVLGDGTSLPLSTIHVRATEYTVGVDGQKAMPAALPPASAYTYAVELSVDEAVTAGARSVAFDRPLPIYLENFLGIPVGWPVPSGYYDRERAAWVPSTDGRVIKILSVANGLAALDVDGNGAADASTALLALGITPEEQQTIASRYVAGQSIWRVPVTHFSAWDFNYAFGCMSDDAGAECVGPDVPDAKFGGPPPEDDPACRPGSIVECQNQILGERIPLTGTPFHLAYQSDRQPGRKVARTVTLQLPTTMPRRARGIVHEVFVAGQKLTQTLATTEPNTVTYAWNGKDAYGRVVQGGAPVVARVGFLFEPVYMMAASARSPDGGGGGTPPGYSFGNYATRYTDVSVWPGTLEPIGHFRTEQYLVFWKTWRGTLTAWTELPTGLGGWSLSAHHAYDPVAKMLYLGDGSRRGATELSPHVISTVTTTIPGVQVWATAMALAPDGSLYTASDWMVSKFDPDGTWSRVAGGGSSSISAAAMPASQASFKYLADVAVGPDGLVYFPVNGFVKRVRADGVMETVAGVGSACNVSPDATLAQNVCLGSVSSLAFDREGSLYVASKLGYLERLLKLSPDGIVRPVTSGTDPGCFGWTYTGCCSNGDGGPADKAHVCQVTGLATGPDGSVYVAQPYKVRRIKPDGRIVRFAGYTDSGDLSMNGLWGFSGDGGKATSARLNGVEKVSAASDGAVYIADYGNQRIRRVSPDGIITTVAGGVAGKDGTGLTPADLGEGNPATAVHLQAPYQAVAVPTGELLITDAFHNLLRKVASPLPGFSFSDLLLASDDGRELFVFDTTGRHLRTLDALTRAVVVEFGYDTGGRLASVTDRDGLVTRVERAGDAPAAIVSPYGERTVLSVDANGYLSSIVNPAGERADFAYDADGLMQTYTDPRRFDHTFRFDSVGRLELDANPAGGSLTLARTELTDGYSVAVTTALGRATRHDVQTSSSGIRTLTDTGPDGTWTRRTESRSGVVLRTSSDGSTSQTTLSSDPRFGMASPLAATQVTTPGGRSFSSSESATATLVSPSDPLSLKTLTRQLTVNGRVATSTYDAATRTVTAKTPAGRTSTALFDAKGRVAQVSAPGVLPVSLGYDASGRLETVTQSARVHRLGYDAQGRLATLTAPDQRTVWFGYDLAGRITTQTLPGGRIVGFAYDANGNATWVTPPGRPSHGFTFGPTDLMTSYLPPSVPGIVDGRTQYGHDADGALTQLLLPDEAAVVPRYDAWGRLETVTTARGVTTVGYDPQGRLQTLSTPDGALQTFGFDGFLLTSEVRTGPVPGTVGWGFDNDLRLASVSVNGSAVSLQYDTDSLLTQAGALTISRDPGSGRISGTTLGSVTTSQTYDGYGALETFTGRVSGSAQYAYTLVPDAAGRIATRLETVAGVTQRADYGYDAAGRLETVTLDGALARSYGYDANGNRVQRTSGGVLEAGLADDQDRLLWFGGASFTYRQSGALESRTVGGQTTSYGYDTAGNLLGVALPDGRLVEYVVDGLNRRVGKKVNGQLVEGFLYEGRLRPAAWLDGAGNVAARFVYGTRVNVPEYMETATGTFRILTDHLGSPRIVVNASTGAVVQRIDYDEWGQILADTNPGFQPFGFAGGLYDRDTGLVRFGARDYDPGVGRWTNKDPIRFAGGLNLYEYAKGDPVNWVDPSGRTSLTFNTSSGILHVDPEQPGRASYDISATSGRGPFMNDQSAAANVGLGPLPAGQYLVDVAHLSNPGLLGDMLRNLRGDWGDWRAPLGPYPGTDTHGRAGFFLHGGRLPGSAGCIDVGGGWFGNPTTDQLLRDLLADPTQQVPLVVY